MISKETFNVIEEETNLPSPLKKLRKKIEETTNWRDIIQQIIKELPVVYDKTQMFWMWNSDRQCYEIIDETDLMNVIDESTSSDTLSSGIKYKIIEAFKREGRKNIPQELPKSWVQFKNKVVDTETGKEFLATPEYFYTNPIPHNIGEKEQTPIIDELLSSWGGEYSLTLKQILAYCCLRDYPIHRIFLLIGSGSNGKGTFLRLLNNFIGSENVASTEMDFLISNQFHVTKLHKKLCCQMSETNFSALKNTSMLKRLSGGDLIGFEYKNKKPFDDYNYAKIIIATNSLPITHDKTDGFYRRWVIVDFKNQFDEKTDPLNTIPESEYEALSRWVCNAIRSLQTQRSFHLEGNITQRKERYESRSNPLETFLKERYQKDNTGYVHSTKFYDDYTNFLLQRGFRRLTYQEVRTQMRDMGYEYERHMFMDIQATWVMGLKELQALQELQAVSVRNTHIGELKVPANDATPANSSHNSLFGQFCNLWKGKIAYQGQALPIEVVQKYLQEVTDDVLSGWILEGLVFEDPKGWVKPT